MKKRMCTFILALVMCLSFLPLTAVAEEAEYHLTWEGDGRSSYNPVTITWDVNSHTVNVRYQDEDDYFILDNLNEYQETVLYKQEESTGRWSAVSGVTTQILHAGDVRTSRGDNCYGSVTIGFFDRAGAAYTFADGTYSIDFQIRANGYPHNTPADEDWFRLTASGSYSSFASTSKPVVAKGTYNGHTYEVYDMSMPWTEAKAYCESLGGYLASVTSEDENSFILNLIRQGDMHNYWSGGYKNAGNWLWVSGESFTYDNWASGEPNNLGNEEAFTHFDGNTGNAWNDLGNEAENSKYGYKLNAFGFVCEYGGASAPVPTPTPTSTPTPTPTPAPTLGNAIQGFTTETVNVGVKLWWMSSPGGVGYRVYRSLSPSNEGISVTDFYIDTNEFIDVNVDANKTYYYTVRQVLKEARPFEGLPEVLGPVTTSMKVTTKPTILGGNASDTSRPKNFILMKLDDPYMSVNGVRQEIDPGRGTAPIIKNSRTIVPIRSIVEAMGGSVGWNSSTRQIDLKSGSNSVVMTLNSKNLTVNGMAKEMDVSPESINDRTYVPIRFSAENLGCAVDWLNSTKQIVIVY